MARSAVTIGFSVPPDIARRVERIARDEGRSKSALFRDMVRAYEMQRELTVLEELAAYGRTKTAELGITSEDDVDRLIHEARGIAPGD